MAWRIDEQILRGEIDNRIRGRVTGRLWLIGRDEPVELALEGNAWRDVAGQRLHFRNPRPATVVEESLPQLAAVQRGQAGDITASRKVKVPDCTMDELHAFMDKKQPFPWHWGNSLYLEWYTEANGRVLIESVDFELELDPEAAWTMSEEEEHDQRVANERAMLASLNRLVEGLTDTHTAVEANEADDAPTSRGEAEAEAEQARMDLLLDRVQARIERAMETGDEPDYEVIMEEERARLRRERGEPEPEPPTPEDEATRGEWIAAMNAAAEEVLEHQAAEEWKDEQFEDRNHPLVERCGDLAMRWRREVTDRGWLGEDDSMEHPLHELVYGVMFAGPKLAGALNRTGDDDEDWPPPPIYAGSTLVRLKKARGYLLEALAGAETAVAQGLAEAAWLEAARRDILALLSELDALIREVRAVLEQADGQE